MTEWTAFRQFLMTDPRDVGCTAALDILHIYIELIAVDHDAATRYPGVAAHLAACGPCGADFEGLLAAVTDASAPPTRGL